MPPMAPALPSNGFCDHDDDITREFAEDTAMDMEHLKIIIADMTRDG